jgi:hypothetical protein
MRDVGEWFPMPPMMGPPLPKWLGVTWPWYKEEEEAAGEALWYHKTLDVAYRVVAFPRTKKAWRFDFGPYVEANIDAVEGIYNPTWGAPSTDRDSLPDEYTITRVISGEEPLLSIIADSRLMVNLPLYECEIVNNTFTSKDSYGHLVRVKDAVKDPLGFSFNGATSEMTIADNPAIKLTEAIHIEAWILLRSYGGDLYPTIMEKGNSYWLRVNNDAEGRDFVFFTGSGGEFNGTNWGPRVSSKFVPALNQWTYVVANYNRKALNIFINNALRNSVPKTAPINQTHYQLIMGNVDHVGYMDGIIGAIRIYNSPLSDAERTNNYLVDRWRYQ